MPSSANNNFNIIEMNNVGLRYDQGPEILSDIKLALKKGSFHFLTGKSGAGKAAVLSAFSAIMLTLPTVTIWRCCAAKSAWFFRTFAFLIIFLLLTTSLFRCVSAV